MRRLLFPFLLGALLSAAGGALAGLGQPLSGVSLGLIYAASLATRLRKTEALAAALGAGLAAEAVSPLPTGIALGSTLAATWLTSALAGRVVAHFSLPSAVGLQAAAYAAFRGLLLAGEWAWLTMAGAARPPLSGHLGSGALQLLAHMLCAAAFAAIGSRLRAYMSARFFLR